MSILNFVTQEELDNLDEDPRTAFMTLVNLAQRSLSKQTSALNGEDENDAGAIDELRHRFMNVIVAAAKRFEIEPFVSMQVPRYQEYRRNFDHREFQADLDHYMTQLLLDNSIKSRHDSVELLPLSRDRLRSHLDALRKTVEQAQLSDAKREALLKRLDDFESELEKRRVSILAVARLTFELLAVPGGLWASVDITHKLVHNVMQTVAQARSEEQEMRKLPPIASMKALSPPRQEPINRQRAQGGGRMNDVIDDDIPF